MALIVGNCSNKQSICTSTDDIHCYQCDYELISIRPPLWSITEVDSLSSCHCASTETLAVHLDYFVVQTKLTSDL